MKGGDNLNERLKSLRKVLNLSQEDFGKKVGVSNTAISKLEKAERNVTDQMILSICREFDVNEEWLRTGEGKMFLQIPVEDEYFKAATEISKSNDKLAMQAVIEYWKLDEDSKKLLRNFIIHIAEKSKE
jgi:transcriptional regulator with XRE-family HTH domain